MKTGFKEGNTIEILSGLKPGDKVVTTGGYGLPDGTKVTVDTANTAGAEGAVPKSAGEAP